MNLNSIELKDFLCGSILGDASLKKTTKSSNSNAIYREGHSKKQQEYLIWKKKVLEKNINTTFNYYEQKHKIYDSITCYIESKTNKYFTKLYNIFYNNGVKHMPLDFISKYFNSLGLAVLFMDDGCTSWRKKYGTIQECSLSLQSFPKEEVEQFQKILEEKFKIYSKISFNRGYRIRIYGENAKRLIEIITPYVSKVDCMKYKINFNEYMKK